MSLSERATQHRPMTAQALSRLHALRPAHNTSQASGRNEPHCSPHREVQPLVTRSVIVGAPLSSRSRPHVSASIISAASCASAMRSSAAPGQTISRNEGLMSPLTRGESQPSSLNYAISQPSARSVVTRTASSPVTSLQMSSRGFATNVEMNSVGPTDVFQANPSPTDVVIGPAASVPLRDGELQSCSVEGSLRRTTSSEKILSLAPPVAVYSAPGSGDSVGALTEKPHCGLNAPEPTTEVDPRSSSPVPEIHFRLPSDSSTGVDGSDLQWMTSRHPTPATVSYGVTPLRSRTEVAPTASNRKSFVTTPEKITPTPSNREPFACMGNDLGTSNTLVGFDSKKQGALAPSDEEVRRCADRILNERGLRRVDSEPPPASPACVLKDPLPVPERRVGDAVPSFAARLRRESSGIEDNLEEEPGALSSDDDWRIGRKSPPSKTTKLPPGWTRLSDPSTGKSFYNHPALGSQWEHPALRGRSPSPDSDDDFVPGSGPTFSFSFLDSPCSEEDKVQSVQVENNPTDRRPPQGLGILGSRLLDAKVAAQDGKAAARNDLLFDDNASTANTSSVKTLPDSSMSTASGSSNTRMEETQAPSEQKSVEFQTAQKPLWARDEVVAPSMMALPVVGFLLTSLI